MNTTDIDQFISLLEINSNNAIFTRAVVFGHGSLFDHALFGGKHQIILGREIASCNDSRDLLPLRERQNVYNRTSLGSTISHGKLVYLYSVDLAKVRKEQHIIVCRRNKELLNKIILFKRNALDSLTAALLRPVNLNGDALYIPGMRNGNNHIFFSDKIFHIQILNILVGNLGTTLI